MKRTLQNCCPLTELPMLSKGGEYKAMHITLGTTFESCCYWRCLKRCNGHCIIIIIIIVLLMIARQNTLSLYQENRSRDPWLGRQTHLKNITSQDYRQLINEISLACPLPKPINIYRNSSFKAHPCFKQQSTLQKMLSDKDSWSHCKSEFPAVVVHSCVRSRLQVWSGMDKKQNMDNGYW